MALGWCAECDLLRSILPGPQKWGSRECQWFPVQHEKPVHASCGEVVDDTPDLLYTCRRCGLVGIDDVKRVPCNGHKRAIK